MDVVWIKSGQGDGGEFFCALHESRYLMLDAIAHKLGLDPTRLVLGEFLLLRDDKGNSVHDVDQLRHFAPDSGDGLSKQTAFVITGPQATTGKSLAELVQKPAPIVPQKWHLRSKQADVMEAELFKKEGSIFHYTQNSKIWEEGINVVQAAIIKFVGSAHLVPHSHPLQKCGTHKKDRPTIMVTLVRPDGYCLTAAKLLEGYRPEDHAILVNFPRLITNSNDGNNSDDTATGCWYECKVSYVQDFVAHLEPLEKKSFDSCMATKMGRVPSHMFESYRTLKLVEMRTIDQVHSERIAMPVSRVSRDLGGPVVDRLGIMMGVVVDTTRNRLAANSKSAKRLKTLRGCPLEVSSKSDFDGRLKNYEEWKEINSSLGRGPLAEHEVLLSMLKTNQVVQHVPAPFKTPEHDWCAEHPLEEFVADVVEELKKPRQKITRVCPRVKNDSWFKDLARDQLAIKKCRSRSENF